MDPAQSVRFRQMFFLSIKTNGQIEVFLRRRNMYYFYTKRLTAEL